MRLYFITGRILLVNTLYNTLYKRFKDDIFFHLGGPKYSSRISDKTDRIKLSYCISDSSISFLDLFLYRDNSSSVLQFFNLRRPSLRESLRDMLETVLPLSLLQRLGISSGNVSE